MIRKDKESASDMECCMVAMDCVGMVVELRVEDGMNIPNWNASVICLLWLLYISLSR